MQTVELTLVGKPECHLCQDAKTVVDRVLAAARENNIDITYSEINILDDDAAAAEYGEDIPVVLLGGRPYASFYVYEDKLAYAIIDERDRLLRRSRSLFGRIFRR